MGLDISQERVWAACDETSMTVLITSNMISYNIKVVANKDLGRQQKWILTHQHCTCLPHAKSRFSTMSTIPISSYRRAH